MRSAERGFTIIELLLAMVVFTFIALGAISALGFTSASGYLETFSTSLGTARAARDYTAAGTYLQSLEEFAATQGFAAAAVGTYAVAGPTCVSGSLPSADIPAGWSGAPCPENKPYQLNWTNLQILIEQWYYDDKNDLDSRNDVYCPPASGDLGSGASEGCINPDTAKESVKLVQLTLTWKFGNRSQTLIVKRFLAQCQSNWPESFCKP